MTTLPLRADIPRGGVSNEGPEVYLVKMRSVLREINFLFKIDKLPQ